jgi:hypothetical protein
MDDKIIITNRGALRAKYGPAGFQAIRKAVANLIAADAKRGLRSRMFFVDDAATMKRHGARAVNDATDPRQNKAAVDAIYSKASPEYLMILGAPDVVPHQDMRNPIASGDDPDHTVPGDLPYACDAPYAREVAKFKGPTRVVGRLPDLTGGTEPSHLLALIDHAITFAPRPAADYLAYFALSTESWKRSTALTLDKLFGAENGLILAPPSGPRHPAKRLNALAHFINCHGAQGDPTFYGEKGAEQPVALTSNAIKGKIRPGTVAAVECCYGAELYDSVTLAGPLPICQHYLAQGAHGYFGSSTIAYGPATGNGAADLITQYWLGAVLKGASTGRAALVARQRFVQQVAELDPVDLKTLAQFNLLGDPSLHPVEVVTPTGLPDGMDAEQADRVGRRERRSKLRAVGAFLEATTATASRKAPKATRSAAVRAALSNIAEQAGIGRGKGFTAYSVSRPVGVGARNAKAGGLATRYYVAVARPNGLRIAAVAKEAGSRIVGYRIYTEK